MQTITRAHKLVKKYIRGRFALLASWLNRVTKGRIRPDDVTWVALVAHVPIMIFILQGSLVYAGLLLIFFGLFDTLDGALARVQNSASQRGMMLDALTDRLKEILLYSGFAGYFAVQGQTWAVIASVLVLGTSMAVSYAKAKGEAVVSTKDIDHAKLNRMFEDGLGGFETRITVLIIGCLFSVPALAIIIVGVLASNTLYVRVRNINKALQ